MQKQITKEEHFLLLPKAQRIAISQTSKPKILLEEAHQVVLKAQSKLLQIGQAYYTSIYFSLASLFPLMLLWLFFPHNLCITPKNLQVPTLMDIFYLKTYHGFEEAGSTTSNTAAVSGSSRGGGLPEPDTMDFCMNSPIPFV